MLSRNIAFSFHLKHSAFCDTPKVLKRTLRPGLRPDQAGGTHEAPQTRSRGWGGGHSLPNLYPYRRLQCLDISALGASFQ